MEVRLVGCALAVLGVSGAAAVAEPVVYSFQGQLTSMSQLNTTALSGEIDAQSTVTGLLTYDTIPSGTMGAGPVAIHYFLENASLLIEVQNSAGELFIFESWPPYGPPGAGQDRFLVNVVNSNPGGRDTAAFQISGTTFEIEVKGAPVNSLAFSLSSPSGTALSNTNLPVHLGLSAWPQITFSISSSNPFANQHYAMNFQIVELVQLAGPSCPADLDGDFDVDLGDLGLMLQSYQQNAGGDIDGDGDTDLADLGALLQVYGVGC